MNFCMVMIKKHEMLIIYFKFHFSYYFVSLFAAAGFYHMQSASDRDEYVKIEWSHILKGKEHNFFKFNSSFVSHFDEAYDYESIMHYPAYGFTKDGYATIVPKVFYQFHIIWISDNIHNYHQNVKFSFFSHHIF